MNIPKAIINLLTLHRGLSKDTDPVFLNAIQLGIEALKYRLEVEQVDPDFTLEPLPGETEE